jgi:2-polyprenyl-3-methyl-5-hydroxy-6-metoxy-1,4-benzoquinol methylase
MIQQIDQAKMEAFAAEMVNVLNGGALALMTSIGHRTGLFDAMAELPPASSARIAAATGLHERYVREWLGAMVTGRIVEYDPRERTYRLPPEHAAFLTRQSTPNNMATTAQFISVLAMVEDRVVDCFQAGGGVSYEAYPRFHQIMAEESNQTVLSSLVTQILPLAEGVTEALDAGSEALDVGCGRGRALLHLASVYPRSRFTGYDFSPEAIEDARREAQQRGLDNIRFEVCDVATLDEPGRYDLITAFDAIHDQARPAEVLRRIAGALAPGGTFLMQDITGSSHVERNLALPLAPYLYTVSTMHCMTVSLALDGEGLGTMWGEEKACEMLEAAGFTQVAVKRLPHDVINNYYIARKERRGE